MGTPDNNYPVIPGVAIILCRLQLKKIGGSFNDFYLCINKLITLVL